MKKDRIWLISAVVCFLAAALSLTGSEIGWPDTAVRILGVINVISLVIVIYRTLRGRRSQGV